MDGLSKRRGAPGVARGAARKGKGGGAMNLRLSQCTRCERDIRVEDRVWLVRQNSTGLYFEGNRRSRDWFGGPDDGGAHGFCKSCVEAMREAG